MCGFRNLRWRTIPAGEVLPCETLHPMRFHLRRSKKKRRVSRDAEAKAPAPRRLPPRVGSALRGGGCIQS